MSSTSRRALLLFVVSFLLSGCFDAETLRPKTPVREIPADVGSMLASAGGAAYGAAAPVAADASALQRAYEGMVLDPRRATLRHEPTLDLVAHVLGALYVSTQRVPALSLERWLFWRCGATALPSGFDIFAFQGDNPGPALDGKLAELARKLPPGNTPFSYGLVRVAFPNQITVQAFVLARRPIEVPSFRKTFAPGEEIELAVRPTLGFTELTFYTDAARGEVRAVPMTARSDQSYAAKIALPTQPGRYFVEVAAIEPRNEAVDPEHPFRKSLLFVPIYVGVPEPIEPDEFIRRPVPNPPDPAMWREFVLRSYNLERARLGRAPLAFDPRVTTLAQRRSDEVAPMDEPRPDLHLFEDLFAAGVPVSDVGSSINWFEYVSEYVHFRLLEPSARAYLLSPATTILGLGLTPRTDATGVRPWAVVEYALEPAGALDVAKARAAFYAELEALDKAEGKTPVARDDMLESTAQAAAEEVCRGTRKVGDTRGVWERVKGPSVQGLRTAGAIYWQGYRADKKIADGMREETKSRGFTRAGVGICQGDLPSLPKGTYVLLMQLGP